MMNVDEYVAQVRSFVNCGAQLEPKRFGYACSPRGGDVSAFLKPNVPKNANSSCGVFGVGMIILALITSGRPELGEPISLQWWAKAEAFAKAHKAFRRPGQGTPGVGCLVHVENALGRHWFTIVRDLGGGLFETVDAGQKDEKGFQIVRLMQRRIVGNVETVSGKPILDWIDVPALFAALDALNGCVAPAIPGAVAGVAGGLHGPATSPATVEGVDVGKDNGRIAWRGVDPVIRFGYARGRIGRYFGPKDQDPLVEYHVAGLLESGREAGIYQLLYPRHGRAQDADVQALELLELHRRLGCTLRPFIDVERAKELDACTGAEWAAALGLWVRTVVAAGQRPIVYGGPGFWSLHRELETSVDPATCDLFLAAYTRTMPPPMKPWDRVLMWQRQGGGDATLAPEFHGRVAGVAQDIDRDTLFGPLDLLRAT